MRSRLTLLLTALLLALALTACGGDQNRNNGTGGAENGSAAAGDQSGVSNGDGYDGAITGSGQNQNGNDAAGGQTGTAGTDDRTDSAGGDLVDDARDALTGAGDMVRDAVDGSAVRQSQGVDYGQMVRNGQVHDRDGDLTDLENSVTPGRTHF